MTTPRYPTAADPAPAYLAGASPDELARMVVALTGEVWVLRDRLMALEEVLTGLGTLPDGAVDVHEPSAALDDRLAVERGRLVEQVLGAPLQVGR